jgi:hypothetical protein
MEPRCNAHSHSNPLTHRTAKVSGQGCRDRACTADSNMKGNHVRNPWSREHGHLRIMRGKDRRGRLDRRGLYALPLGKRGTRCNGPVG